MNNKLNIQADILQIIIEKIKMLFDKSEKSTDLFENLCIPEIKIDEKELQERFELFDLNKENSWQFSIKNWSK